MKLKHIIYSFIASTIVLFSACSPDDYDLGVKDMTTAELTQGSAYSVTPDASNPNIIHLKSNLNGYTCLWTHPQGRSQEKSVDLNIAFPGTYTVTFGIETRGGIVYGEPYTFDITTSFLGFVQDELWTNLTGGVDKSKTWIPNDWDYGFGAVGELTYADPATTVEFNNWKANWDPGKGVTSDDGIFTSSMTFSLSATEGTVVKIVNNTAGAVPEKTGTYMLDKDAHTLSFTDCSILHTQGWDSKASNWTTDLKVLTLSENFLQVGIWRTNDEGNWWMVLNFVSKEFADNFTKVEPAPVLDDGYKPEFKEGELLNLISGGKGSARKWVIDSENNPVDWVGKGKGWTTSASSSYNWGWNDDWNAISENSWIMFDQLKGIQTYTRSQDGVQTTGTFTINENEETGFSEIVLKGEKLIQNSSSWMNPTSDTIVVVKAWPAAFDTKGIWLSSKASYGVDKDEWLVFHYVLPGGIEKTSIDVDNSKIKPGKEGENNFRIEIYNIYSSTHDDPPIDPKAFVFSNNITVTFTISGLSLIDGAAGSYGAGLGMACADWSASYWGDGTGGGDVSITGDGTYTVSWNPGKDFSEAIVFCIDIKNIFSDIVNPDAIKVTIDKVLIY